MFLVFIDECGYSKNWEKCIKEQPVHVTSAVAIKADDLLNIICRIKNSLASLSLHHVDVSLLGKGEEIKASSVDRGDDFWSKNPLLRDAVRKAYLDHSEQVTYFLVCIDKQRHRIKYSKPDDPADLAIKYLLERIQGFLVEQNDNAYVLIDANKRIQEKQRNFLFLILRRGSEGYCINKWFGIIYTWHLSLDNILEIQFGDSQYSIGLQIADFVARHAYSWYKAGKKNDYPGWQWIEPRLYRHPNYFGWGYKEFPLEEVS
jgi:hypothetical protein